MGDGVTNYLLTQGVLGVSVLTLGIVVVFLYKKGEKKDEVIYNLQEARRVDDRQTLKEVTGVVQGNSQAMLVLSEKIEIGKSIERGRR